MGEERNKVSAQISKRGIKWILSFLTPLYVCCYPLFFSCLAVDWQRRIFHSFMAAPPPTVEECCDWVYEHCATFDDPDNDDRNVQVALDSVAILVNALDAPASVVSRLKDRIKSLKQSVSPSPDQVKKVVWLLYKITGLAFTQ